MPRRQARNFCKLAIEHFEQRQMLACDIPFEELAPGDANMDCFIDIADFVQVLKFDKSQGDPATWEEGDFSGNGIIDHDDFRPWVVSRREPGIYDDRGTNAENELRPISSTGVADVLLYYFPESGKVAVIASQDMSIRALHIVSQSDSINDARRSQFFDRSSDHFHLVYARQTSGAKMIEFTHLLPPGWTEQQVLDDLLIDGALVGGGDLGNVRLGNRDEFPLERPEEFIKVPETLFVEADQANGILTYDPDTGDILVETWDLPMSYLKLESRSGLLSGTTWFGADRYERHGLDHANPTVVSRIAYEYQVEFVDGEPVPEVNISLTPGFFSVNLPEIAELGLSKAEFIDEIQPEGLLDWSVPLKLVLKIGPTFGLCREIKEQATIVGDANQDGRFDSQDLVAVFQANEYSDGIEDNSTWSEGDWTCDGDFDTDDFVAAFQTGLYERPAAAVARLDLLRARSMRREGYALTPRTISHSSLATNRRTFVELETIPLQQFRPEATLRLREQSLVRGDVIRPALADQAHLDGDIISAE
ncbi:MAG: hypothetical protein KDB27_22345 [Planctomycetales bacterium]|nr:hypothetical protein [Planctomycetales bacterium]